MTSLSGVGASCGGTAARARPERQPAVAGAGRFSTDSRPPGISNSTARIAACRRRRIGDDLARCGQRAHPLPEIALGHLDHPLDRARHRALFLEQPVVDLLDVVGDFAEVHQADHAPAALQRVEAAADRAQRLAIAVVAHEQGEVIANRVEHLVRLREVDLDQLGIETGRIGGEQPLRLGRYFGRGRRRVGHRRDRRRQRGGASGRELGQRRRRPARPARRRRSARRRCAARPAWSSAPRARRRRPARDALPRPAAAARCAVRPRPLRPTRPARARRRRGTSPRRRASSGAIRRSRSGRCCSTASM